MAYTSLDFNGSNSSYLSIPSSAFSLGTDDFTIEWWQYEIDYQPFPRVFSSGSYDTESIVIAFDREGSSPIYWYTNSAQFLGPLPEPYFETWMHYAIVRESGVITVYLNGQVFSTFSDTTDYVLTENLCIGNETSPSGVAAFTGQIYNFMWLKGVAKYTAPFTPSTDLPNDPSNYTLILNGSYIGGTEENNVTNVNVGQSINVPNVTPDPPPQPIYINPPYARISSNSFGQFWYGNATNFPGFLYKKNVGVGGRRSTKFAAGGNMYTNKSRHIFNKYKPGVNGIGASTIANRRAKNRLASVCGGQNSQCGQFYQYLGRYSPYTENPNGYFTYP